MFLLKKAIKKNTASKRRPKNVFARVAECGFTLVETMFAMVFLAVGLLAMAQLIPLASSQIVSSRNQTLASEMASEMMSELNNMNYSDAGLAAGAHSETSGKHTISYTVTDDTPVPNCKQIAMTVSWEEATGTRTVTYNTVVSR